MSFKFTLSLCSCFKHKFNSLNKSSNPLDGSIKYWKKVRWMLGLSNLCLKTGEQVKLEVNSKKNLTIEKLYWVWKNRFNSSKIFYFILTGAVFVLVSLLVVMIAGSGLIQIHTRILDKILPVDQLSCPDDDSSDEEDSTYNTVRQFRVRYTCNYLKFI